MREIKFRAYIKDTLPYGKSGMCKVQDLLKIQNGIKNIDSIYVEIDKETSPYKDQNYWQIFKNHFELMQYTGLKDKNGKEIYEGDILKGIAVGKWKKPPEKLRCEVTLEPDMYGYKLLDNVGSGEYLLSKNNTEYWEVIGNIYENKELLEE